MIDLHYWPTPNGWKITIALEEMALPYRVVPVNIARGDQHLPEFLAISPNGRMPAIVDDEPMGGGAPLAIFESGAILLYLAEKSGLFLPRDVAGRFAVTQWLFWQVGGLGPMLGQNGHFRLYAPERLEYAMRRYGAEARRLLGVLDRRLEDREYICGDYSIADMACWPWLVTHKRQELGLDDFVHVRRWYDAMKTRPGVRRGYDVGKEMRDLSAAGPDALARQHLFNR